jgi:hypothetical protein
MSAFPADHLALCRCCGLLPLTLSLCLSVSRSGSLSLGLWLFLSCGCVFAGQKPRPADAPWKTPTVVVFYCGNGLRSGKLLQKTQATLLKVRCRSELPAPVASGLSQHAPQLFTCGQLSSVLVWVDVHGGLPARCVLTLRWPSVGPSAVHPWPTPRTGMQWPETAQSCGRHIRLVRELPAHWPRTNLDCVCLRPPASVLQ